MPQKTIAVLLFLVAVPAAEAQDQALEDAIDALGSDDWQVRERASETLVQAGFGAWSRIERELAHEDREVAGRAATVLSRIRAKLVEEALASDDYLRYSLLRELGDSDFGNPDLEARNLASVRAILGDPKALAQRQESFRIAIQRVGPTPATWTLFLLLRETGEAPPGKAYLDPCAGFLRDPEGLAEAAASLGVPRIHVIGELLRELALLEREHSFFDGPGTIETGLVRLAMEAGLSCEDPKSRRRALLLAARHAEPEALRVLAGFVPANEPERDLLLAVRAWVGDDASLDQGLARLRKVTDEGASRLLVESLILSPRTRELPSRVLEWALGPESELRYLAIAAAARLGTEAERERVRESLELPPVPAHEWEDDWRSRRALAGLLERPEPERLLADFTPFAQDSGGLGLFLDADSAEDQARAAWLRGLLAIYADHARPADWQRLADRLASQGTWGVRAALGNAGLPDSVFYAWLLARSGDAAVPILEWLASNRDDPVCVRWFARAFPERAGPLYRVLASSPYDTAIDDDPATALGWARAAGGEGAASVARRIVSDTKAVRRYRLLALLTLREVDPNGWTRVVEEMVLAEGRRYREENRYSDPAPFHAALDLLEAEPIERAVGVLASVLGQTMMPESVIRRAIRMIGRRGGDPRAARILAGLTETNWERTMCPPVSTSRATEVALVEALADLAPESREARLAALRVERAWDVSSCFPLEAERQAFEAALARVVAAASREEIPLWEETAEGDVLRAAVLSRKAALGLPESAAGE
ncbi:MAG: hypothetical protein HY720_07870 [Planctomycetes bacterium]|nr:hypothetical protein [Planctomycetota bacterium]